MKIGFFLCLLLFSIPSLGGSWSGSSSLTSGSHQNLAADGAVDGAGSVWVAWFSNRSQPLLQLYTKSYDGSSWDGDTRLSSSFDDLNPGLATDSSGRLWMVYQSSRAGCLDSGVAQPTYDLCYRNWSGSAWSSPANLSTDGASEFTPQAAGAPDGSLRVLWSSDRAGNYDILAASLNASGPGTPVSVTTDSHPDFAPDILRASDGTWWAAWFREMTEGDDTTTETFLRGSADGITWGGGETQLTNNGVADKLPTMAQDPQGTYWLAWASTQGGNTDIYVANATTPLGLAAAVPQRRTTSAGTDSNPSLMVDNGGTLWLFYESREPPEPQGYVHLRYMTRDDSPPRILSAGPSGTLTSSSATLVAATHENAECRYSASDQNYTRMDPARTMSGGGTKSHSAGVTASAGENRFYISCRDTAGNPMDNASQVAFTYTPPSSGGGGGGGGGGDGGGGFVSPSTPAPTPKPASTPTLTPTPTPAPTLPPTPTATPALASASTPAPEPTLPPLQRESRGGPERGVADHLLSGVLGAVSTLRGLPPIYLAVLLFAVGAGIGVGVKRRRRRPY